MTTWNPNFEKNDKGGVICWFSKDIKTTHSHIVDVYVTGNLAFQAMALRKESMSGWWCMLCKASRAKFLDEDSEMWTMDEYRQCGLIAENNPKDEPELGVKQRPWWPFIPLTHYVSPLLHNEIGIGNLLLDLLRDIINEYVETYALGEEAIRLSIPALKQIIRETAMMRDNWDESDDGKELKKLTKKVAAYKRRWGQIGIAPAALGDMANVDDERERAHMTDQIKLNTLQEFRKSTFANKLQKARKTLASRQGKLKEMRRTKVRGQLSIETKVFRVLKEIGVELSSYHGGSLNGKDIKKVMNNASHIFDQFAVIFQEGKRKDCLLSDVGIKEMCMHFREVYVLWDGAFSLAQKFAPTDEDCKNYQKFVNAALQGSMILQCSITPKMHSMLRHVKWQMKNLPGGLGDKMEDWVERQHQWGMRMRRRFRTVQDPLVHALAREKAASRNMHSDVRAQVESTDVGNKRNFLEKKANPISIKRQKQRDEGRFQALEYFGHHAKEEEKLTWVVVLFNDGKVDSYDTNTKVLEYLCQNFCWRLE